jgi:hypothetical protein
MKKNNEEKKESNIRQIIIETDGSTIQIKKIEVAGVLEAKAIFDSVIGYLNQLPEISQKEKNSV